MCKGKLINKTAIRELILQTAEVTRPGWPVTQVSSKALDQVEKLIEKKTMEMIERLVWQHPSIGHTFKEVY